MTFRVADDQRYMVTECWHGDRLIAVVPGTAVKFDHAAVIDCCNLSGAPLIVNATFKVGLQYCGTIEADLGVVPERRCFLLVNGGIRARVRVNRLRRP